MQRELDLPLRRVRRQRRDDRSSLNAGRVTVNASAGISQIHTVEYVEEIRAELKRIALAESDVFRNDEIGIKKRWTAQGVEPCRAKGPNRWPLPGPDGLAILQRLAAGRGEVVVTIAGDVHRAHLIGPARTGIAV